ncbi:hypothetical protein CQ014_18030 [Pseudomonas lurida]|nr:hypothetical protein CLM75_11560 [Pseudomonas lurida]PRA14824.1 hypothetical protein CQ002_19135 [Pseudomonas sp. MYb13]PRA20654.1 hypothetical protein CQ004_17905 [Pseudomonas lurida]PRA32749.1 hypothetical protein CQ005_18605 [Pseudomonas lurida]PRB99810.1 hypothetical protein CQ014_18030 [Pseudomonas lurida]
MQATRYIRHSQWMPSQASQLPHLTEFGSKKPVGFTATALLLLILILGTPSLGEVPSVGASALW